MTLETASIVGLLTLFGILISSAVNTYNRWMTDGNEIKKAEIAKDTALAIAKIEKQAELEKHFATHEVEQIIKIKTTWDKYYTTLSELCFYLEKQTHEQNTKFSHAWNEVSKLYYEMSMAKIKNNELRELLNLCTRPGEKAHDIQKKAAELGLKISKNIVERYKELKSEHLG